MTPNNREELVELMAIAMGLEEPNEFWCDTARAAIIALDTAGIALVPRVATEEMRNAGEDAIDAAFVLCESPVDTWETEAN